MPKMSKSKKTALFILIILLLGTVSAGSIYFYFSEQGNQEMTNAEDGGYREKTTEQETSTKNPFGEPFLSPINEKVMQQYIHAMSHQKVEAKQKWSFYEMTDERILYLLGELDKGDYEHEQVYRDILVKWQEGNFSEVDHDHNEVWTLRGGTVGAAKGILSSEEEQAYLRKQRSEKR
ncbi:hypothetical protein FZC79_10710 [Rossellomorea vietnamensis]|uniref:Uncharacterized protein n=1 Tax=Rossellomorea vietnamensis TaxID=218284 RepID=A0A5D4KD20_9BACI|nr:DUF6241 domain-containing protein [Rossellomorea vietnamensis]TYR75228.1 hypothetical protein FZC79_10710 [Rossellomorea vietnamensis]